MTFTSATVRLPLFLSLALFFSLAERALGEPDSTIDPHAASLKNEDGSWKYTNRLSDETSPYLLLHAHNPVDWYPWGAEALSRARSEDKPIFLSVGYSTCYWCHVMERLVFSDPEIAHLMNEWFVSIKVDREERPDIDQLYMTATQLISGHGGWPNSVFLTPELKPFFAGTYFPPDDDVRVRRPGFRRVLTVLHDLWKDERSKVEEQAEILHTAVLGVVSGRTAESVTALKFEFVLERVRELKQTHDRTHGGFGSAPKFPSDQALDLLLEEYRRSGDKELLGIVTYTLDRMAAGGIHDHLGGGFHRYATDAKWLVPHFEKMLYNQAALARIYLDAFEITRKERYRRTAQRIFDFVSRVFTGAHGGFYSALDSETNGVEGEYYLWTEAEIADLLGERKDLFLQAFSLAPMPEGEGLVIYDSSPTEGVADDLSIRDVKSALLEVRQRRLRPLLDTKVLTAWNGMMIRAYARGFEVLADSTLLHRAEKAADFVRRSLRSPEGRIRRTYRDGKSKQDGFLEDYAFLVQGLLSLYRVTGNETYLAECRELSRETVRLFWDQEAGGYFVSADRGDLFGSIKSPYDGAIPSGNSAALHTLLTLAQITEDPEYLRRAGDVLQAFGGALQSRPGAFTNMIHGLHRYLQMKGSGSSPPELLTLMANVSIGKIVPGVPFDVEISLDIRPGWHINANPASEPFLIPTSVVLSSDQDMETISVDYPAGKALRLGFQDKPLSLYEGRVGIHAVLKLDPGILSGQTGTLSVQIAYQACDSSRCLAPTTLQTEQTYVVGSSRSR